VRVLGSAPRVVAVALVVVPALSAIIYLVPRLGGVSIDVTVTVDRATPVGLSRLEVGTTHSQHSLERGGDPTALASASRLLRAGVHYQNQHIYGWGAANPEPAPGRFDWRTLDRRVALMRSTAATPVITLCCAPDWMTIRGKPTSTYPNLPPTPAHYGDFARLAARVAQRYPDVTYFVVWNEMKGFWDAARRQWDFVAYTKLYNQVYDALKAVNPAIAVGGPYLVIEGTGFVPPAPHPQGNGPSASRTAGAERSARPSARPSPSPSPPSARQPWYAVAPISRRNWAVIEYWLAHAHGAQFLAIDRGIHDSHDPVTYSRATELTLAHWYGDIARQLHTRTTLPIWYIENKFSRSDERSEPFHAVGMAEILYHECLAGVAAVFQWRPEAEDSSQDSGEDLFTSTRSAGGGQALPAYFSSLMFHMAFSPGTRLYRTATSSPLLQALASSDHILLINAAPRNVVVRVNGRIVRLARYEVRLLDRGGATVLSTRTEARPGTDADADQGSRQTAGMAG